MRPNLAARLGGWSARHRKTAIVGWLLFVVAAVLIGGMAGQQRLTDGEQGTGDSGRAERILDQAGIEDPASEMVLVHSATVNGFRAALPEEYRKAWRTINPVGFSPSWSNHFLKTAKT